MNKGELINKIAEDANLSRSQATEALNAFIKSTSDALRTGDKLTLVGFGNFSVSNRSARKGRNPQTGKEISIPGRKVVKFKAGKDLADNIN
jgi:DNA-binding protein HU-beta